MLEEEKSVGMKSGFEKEIEDLIETKSFFIDEWKAAYKSMEPEEIYNFLTNWATEIFSLKSEAKLDFLSKGIISNVLFKQLVERYPGTLISNNLKEKLIEKMEEKTSPLQKLTHKINGLLEEGKYKEIKDEISELFDSYENFIGNKEFLNDYIEKFMSELIEKYQDKEIELDILIFLTGSYLNFLKDKKCNPNHALFFMKLGSYFFEKKDKTMAKSCVLKSKQIYKELGFEKDQAKVDGILKNLQGKTPKLKKSKKNTKAKKKGKKSKRKKK